MDMAKWKIGWGVTAKCNLNCQFCYSATRRRHSGNLVLADWKRFVDRNACRIESINYGTGENALCDEWFDLVSYVRDKFPEIRQGVTTNGQLGVVCESSAESRRIVESGIDEVDVSLDFADRDSHNRFRGHRSCYDWVLLTLELCKELGCELTIVCLGTNETLALHNLAGIFRVASDFDSVVRMNPYRPLGPDKNTQAKFVPSFARLIYAIDYVDKKQKILKLADPLFASLLTTGYTPPDPSGVDSVRILPDGSVTPSTYLLGKSFVVGNILSEDVFSMIEHHPVMKLFRDSPTPRSCLEAGCEYLPSCRGGVKDRRMLFYGTLEERDIYCPHREGNFVPDFRIDAKETADFPSVHDGYLPTFFFRPSGRTVSGGDENNCTGVASLENSGSSCP